MSEKNTQRSSRAFSIFDIFYFLNFCFSALLIKAFIPAYSEVELPQHLLQFFGLILLPYATVIATLLYLILTFMKSFPKLYFILERIGFFTFLINIAIIFIYIFWFFIFADNGPARI